MSGCIQHEGAPAFGCGACNRLFAGRPVDGATAARLMDDAYSKGFRDGVAWVVAGVRVQTRDMLRMLSRSVQRLGTKSIGGGQ